MGRCETVSSEPGVNPFPLGIAVCTHETDLAIEVKNQAGLVFWVPRRAIAPPSEVKHVRDHGNLVVDETWWKTEGAVDATREKKRRK